MQGFYIRDLLCVVDAETEEGKPFPLAHGPCLLFVELGVEPGTPGSESWVLPMIPLPTQLLSSWFPPPLSWTYDKRRMS